MKLVNASIRFWNRSLILCLILSIGIVVQPLHAQNSQPAWTYLGADSNLEGLWPTQLIAANALDEGIGIGDITNLISKVITPKVSGKLVHRMEVQWPGIAMNVKRPKQSEGVKISEANYEDAPHYVVKTPRATYYYDRQGGGFSRIIDADGKDWISFVREPWGEYPAAAASSFRGLPNLVYQGKDNGAGHPGHKQCTSKMDRNKIITETLSGLWKWTWTFEDDHAHLNIERTDLDRNYWFLYEGTPGGKYKPTESYYGTDQGGPVYELHDFYQQDLMRGHFQWMYAGTVNLDRIFYLVQEEKDDKEDILSFLGNTEEGLASSDGMTVWGFGRNAKTESLLSGNQEFIIGFYPNRILDFNDHQTFEEFIMKFHLTTE